MTTFMILYLTVLAVGLTQARVTYRNLLQLAKPADESFKADHEIQLGELDDKVDFKSILEQMGHEFNFKESNGDEPQSVIGQLDGTDSMKTSGGTDSHLDENVKAGECACSGKTCVCCCVLTFTYEGKRYYIYFCVRVTFIRDSVFYFEFFLQGQKVHSVYVSSPSTNEYVVNSYFKVGCRVYHVSSTKICFYCYFVVNGTTYKCESHCLTVSASHSGLDVEKATE